MSGTPLDEKARPVVEAMAKKEDRVVMRCRPYETFAQPPRHLHRNDQEERDHALDRGEHALGRSGRRVCLKRFGSARACDGAPGAYRKNGNTAGTRLPANRLDTRELLVTR